MCQSTKEALRRLMTPLHRWDTQKPEESFPRQKVEEFFEADDGQRIQDLAHCKCEFFQLGCASYHQPFDEYVVQRIRNKDETYIVVLAFLCFVEHTGLIHKFIEKGYSDQRLHEHPLERQQFDELFPSPESDGQAYSHIEFDFFRFFMPVVHGPDKQQTFLPMQTLPFEIIERIGEGGYGIVYRAKMLDGGYCKFVDKKVSYPYSLALERYAKDWQDGLVAIKRYTSLVTRGAGADWEKEWRNNVMYNEHPHINPILASIAHGDVYMNVYTLCEGDLQKLFTKDPRPEDHEARSIWRQYMGLLSALNYIHCSLPTQFGYHFDIKTSNILVILGQWMIADLGLLHCKNNEGGMLSTTPRRLGSQEFGAPETTVTRKFDIWGIACVGCIVLAWLRLGASGVERFREDRKQEVLGHGMKTILYNFYSKVPDGHQLHPAVENLLFEATDDLSKGVAAILRDMLSIDVERRLTAEEAEKRFGEVLGVTPLKVSKPPQRPRSVSAHRKLVFPGQRLMLTFKIGGTVGTIGCPRRWSGTRPVTPL